MRGSTAYAEALPSHLRVVPRASFLVRQVAAPPTAAVIPAGEMARRLRDGGLPIAAIAEICNVERKTVYSWLDGASPREPGRLDTIFRLLSPYISDLGALHRVWNRTVDGHTLKAMLCAEPLSEPTIKMALSELSAAVKWHAGRDTARRTRAGGANPVIDAMPVASTDR